MVKFHVESVTELLERFPVSSQLPCLTISVCGSYRTGKSLQMSIFVRYFEQLERCGGNHKRAIEQMKKDKRPLTEFKAQSGSTPVTTGVSIWGRPYKINRNNGKLVAVYLIDSEGTSGVTLDAIDREAFNQITAKDMRNLILTSLISSVSLYNIRGQIKTEDIETIQEFSKFLKILALYENKGAKSNKPKRNVKINRAKPLQSLVFVNRDFAAFEFAMPSLDSEDEDELSNSNLLTKVDQFGFHAARQYVSGKSFVNLLEPYIDHVDFFAVPEPSEYAKDKKENDNKLRVKCEFHFNLN